MLYLRADGEQHQEQSQEYPEVTTIADGRVRTLGDRRQDSADPPRHSKDIRNMKLTRSHLFCPPSSIALAA